MKPDSNKIAIVVSLFNSKITLALLKSCTETLREHAGLFEDDLTIVRVPGAFEVPLVCKKLANKKDISCVIAIACVIRGDTPHFDYISAEVTRGLMTVSLETNKPIVMGVLTTNTEEQARVRCHIGATNPKNNDTQNIIKPAPSDKGTEFALSALRMMEVFKGEL